VYTLTVRTDPGWTVAHSPFVFFKTFRADLKSTAAAPAEWLFLFAAMAAIFFVVPPPSSALFFLYCHTFFLYCSNSKFSVYDLKQIH